MNVFLVDDSAMVLEKLKTMLSNIDGMECTGQSQNARDAIESIPREKPDLVILDIRLNGGSNGMEVLSQIKKAIPPPIVVMLTNYPYPQYKKKCLELGAEFFFDKVTEIEKVYEILVELIKDKPEGGQVKEGERGCS